MPSIKKLTDGKFLIRVSRGTGKNRVWSNVTFEGTRKEAEAKAREMETLADAGLDRNAALTFGVYKTQWLTAIKPNLAPLTFDSYEGNIRRHTAMLDQLKLAAIRTDHIQNIYNGLSTAVQRSLHATLNACFNYARRRHYININPCTFTDRPRRRRPAITFLTPDDVRVFIDECQRDVNGVMFEFAIETGMRPEEYLAVRWPNLIGNDVLVDEVVQYNRSGGGFYFARTKTAGSRRRIPISDNLRRRLITHRREQNEHRIAMRGTWANHNLIFANAVGNPLERGNVLQRMFRPLVTRCGLDPKFTLYTLRHTMATTLLINGENPKVVSERLGHTSVVLTLDTYSHVIPHMQAEATKTMDRAMRGS